MNEIDPKQS